MDRSNGYWSDGQAVELAQLMLRDSRQHGVFFYDYTSRITGWSEGAHFITGWTAAEVLGQPTAIFWTPEDNKHQLAEHEVDTIRIVGVAENERWHMRKDGSQFWCSGVSLALRDPVGRHSGFVKIFRDSTNLRARIKYLENVAQECDVRMKEKDVFTGMVAHEMRNPLSPLKTSIELLKRLPADSARLASPISVMSRQVVFLEKLIEDLIDVTRVQTGKMSISYETVILQEVLFEALHHCSEAAEAKGLRVHHVMPPVAIYVEADPQRLMQVTLNLLNNSIKYTSSGGDIWLVATVDQTHFICSIKDNGQGISPDLLPKIFDILTQASNPDAGRGAGLGLGLAVVKEIVSQHQGNVEVRSDGPDKGSEFIIRIPVRRSRGSNPEPFPALN